MSEILVQLAGILLYAFFFFGVGAVVVISWRVPRDRPVLAFCISVGLLVFAAIATELMNGSVAHWLFWLMSSTAIIAVMGVYKSRRARTQELPLKNRNTSIWFYVIIFTLLAIYHFSVGPYTEIPSDFWSHLEKVKEIFLALGSDARHSVDLRESTSLIVRDGAIPAVHAVVALLLTRPPLELVPAATFTSTLAILLCVFWLSQKFADEMEFSPRGSAAIGLLTVFLFFLTYGVSTFSYVRYYAYFPHIWNMALFFSVIGLFLKYSELDKTEPLKIFFVLGLIVVMYFVNRQEAFFAILTITFSTIVRAVRLTIDRCGCRRETVSKAQLFGLCALLTIVFGGALGYLVAGEVGTIHPRHVIDLGKMISKEFPSLFVANPGARFWETIGWFGLVIYVWFFLKIRNFFRLEVLLFGMVSPLITMFNPIFVEWFFGVSNWDALWRFAYLVPVPFVAALLVGKAVVRGSKTLSRGEISGRVFAVTLAGTSIVPFDLGPFTNHSSRWWSIISVEKENGAKLWRDLIDFLNGLDSTHILLTDSITNYVVSSASKQRSETSAKERWQTGRELFGGDYKDRLLYYGQDDRLIIINLRNGAASRNGRMTGHWPENILDVSRRYPDDLVEFLDAHRPDFEKIWDSGDILVYKILRDPEHY